MSQDRYFEPDIETMTRSRIDEMQRERLADVVVYVAERSPLIREVWADNGVRANDVSTLEDFIERAPVIDKDSIRRFRDETGDPFGGLLCLPREELTTLGSTSGTTGDPTIYPDRVRPWAQLYLGMARDYWSMGVRPGDVVLISPPSAIRGPTYQVAHAVGAIPLVVDNWIGKWPQTIEMIYRHHPVYFAFGPPQLPDLISVSDRYDIRDVFSCFKAVSWAGEPLGPRMRLKLTDEWGMNLFTWTSAGDTGCAYECDRHDGCHVWEDTVIVEVHDPDKGGPTDADVGELVVTAIDNPIAPLIRYRTDDLVRLTREPCGCGRTHSRIWPLGRKTDQLIVEGQRILPIDIWGAVESVPATSKGVFQMIREGREMDRLRVRVGINAGVNADPTTVASDVSDSIESAIGVRPDVEVVPESVITLGATGAKFPRVVVR